MSTAQKIINTLRTEFIQEATSAPKLFKDLAKVEHYIAESYKTRSFIELIQNADDAQSTVFGVHGFNGGLIVANNGRPFTFDDVEALCRSGSSNKSRGNNTIGYRGIGFKSVVNLASRIYVFSGDFAFYFEKAATKALLPEVEDVPLIRIPHQCGTETNERFLNIIDELKGRYRYSTLFIFLDINKRIAEEELSEFDRSSLLFLNNIREAHFDRENIKRTISIEKGPLDKQSYVRIKEADSIDEWDILRSPKDPRDVVALKRSGDSIIPALPEESVIHSFTPTVEFAGAYIKVNGDYSTDPSRKNIDMDEFSRRSFDNTVSLITDTIIDILDGRSAKKGFFSPFIKVINKEGNKFKALLFKTIAARLNETVLRNLNGKTVGLSSIRLRPEWLNYEDYERLCNSDLTYLSKELVLSYPELPVFLEQLGIKKLYLDEIIGKINSADLSIAGAGQIVTKIINQYRYDMTQERVSQLKHLNIFPIGNELVCSVSVKSTESLNKGFLNYILQNVNQGDVRYFFLKLGITADAEALISEKERENGIAKETITPKVQSSKVHEEKTLFKATPNIQKWRSAEKNAEEYFKSLEGVLNVSDVSTANMGYDLDVLMANGKRLYVEVKSVTSFSEPIKLTNNEYASAHSYGASYCLAIVINEEPFQIRIVPDPINVLSFQKQIERWSWFCDSYMEGMKDVEELLPILGGRK